MGENKNTATNQPHCFRRAVSVSVMTHTGVVNSREAVIPGQVTPSTPSQ